MKAKAVVLVSGGLDSAVTLFYAVKMGYACSCLGFDYGQRHRIELVRAARIAEAAGADFQTVRLELPWKGSSLIDRELPIPLNRTEREIKSGIPSTYVPARNTIFLGLAASLAEAIGADSIFIGAHSEDSSGYPDCRREYLEAFEKMLRLGTRRGLEGRLDLQFPLISKSKREIIELGRSLGVPFELTWSCYRGETSPCRECDSCLLRAKGFREAGLKDPAMEMACA